MGQGEAIVLGESREEAVQAELNQILQSPAFRTSKRCREFLEYIVAHTISGPGGALKERSIGVELFRLAPDFDPGQHTIVRVTANEVRKKLAQNYLAENGSFHPVRIDLPPGSYRAEFRWETPAAEPVHEQPAEALAEPSAAALASIEPPAAMPPPAQPRISTKPNWVTRPMVACAVAVLAICGAIAWWRLGAVKPIAVDAKSGPEGGAFAGSPIGSEDLRITVGSADPYMDRSGRKWGSDRFFSGGSALFRPSGKIGRTLDPDLYRRLRQGEFQYDIPLKPGSYELHLHFAETGLADFISAESSGEGQRLFRVTANGKRILDFFDVVADADGANTSDERVFRDLSPSGDGFLHLAFSSMRGAAMLSGIEVLPVSAGKVRPIRIRAGWTASWQDSDGQPWQADSYFLGGNALLRTSNPAQESDSTASERALYASERWGHFSYAVPVADGRYRVKLKFCEGHYGRNNTGVGGLGSRVFDVYCNGVALLRNFDIFKEAGGEGRPLDRVFSGIRPAAQGKIVLSFVPIKGMACVNGIEVVEDSK
jgi:hypothetical protein